MPRAPAAWLYQGTAVHEAISKWEHSERQWSAEEALKVFRESWEDSVRKAWIQEPDPTAWQRSGTKKTETDLKDRFQRGQDQVRTYIAYTKTERLKPWRLPDGKPASEVEFRVDFGGVEVLGYIDLIMQDPVSGELLVRDVKTGSKKPVGWFQLATYRHAIRKQYGADPHWGDYWMAKDGKPLPPYDLGSVPEAQVTSQFQIMDIAENSGLYGANIGEHCGRCDVARHCPFAGGTPPVGVPALGT